MNLLARDVIVGKSAKTDRCLYTRTKEHSYHTESVIHQHLSTCRQFQHIKALLTPYPDDDAKSNQTSIMAEHVFHNTKVNVI